MEEENQVENEEVIEETQAEEVKAEEAPVEEAKEDSKDDRKMYPAKCSECGSDCEVPFEPEEGKPVKCRECFMKSRPKKRFNNNNNNNNRGFDRGPREMHDTKCTKCGKQCQVPFKPTPGKDVLCRECFSNNRN